MKSNLIYSVLGVVFQTLFPLIVYPYITRVLGVSNLGEYNFYASTVAYMALFSTFGISMVGVKEIGQRKDDKQAYSKVFADLFKINLLLSIPVYLLIFCLILFSPSYQNGKLFLITSITILGNAIGAEHLFTALEKQKFMLLRNIIFKVISLFLIFLFVKTEDDLIVYALIMLLSTVGVSLTNIIAYNRLIDWSQFTITLNLSSLWPYFLPLAQVFLMDILNHYYGGMDVIILGNMDSTESVGYYSTAYKIYALTYTFLASTAIPLLPRAAYYVKSNIEAYNSLIRRCYDIYLFFTSFFAFILFSYSKEIIELIAGEAFAPGSISLRYFALTLVFSSFCNFFIFQVLYPYNKIKSVLHSQLIGIVVHVLLSLILIPTFSYNGASQAFFISYIILFVALFACVYRLLPSYKGGMTVIKEIIGLLICFFIAKYLKIADINFLISITIICVGYFILELVMRNSILIYFIQLVLNKIKSMHDRQSKPC